jgi:spore coat polysaccharide biosynthesis protein SpsF
MKIVAIIQARMGSTRLPGKVMMDLKGKPALQRVIDRVSKAKLVDEIVVATESKSEAIIQYCLNSKINCFIGPENNVMKRVLDAASTFGAETIVEITADCPVIDPKLIDDCIRLYNNNPHLDYVSNCVPVRSFPDGCDVQVYSIEALAAMEEITKPKTRNHVGWNLPNGIYDFNCICIPAPEHLHKPDLRLTLDTIGDYLLIQQIYKYFWHDAFNTADILDFLHRNPELLELNKDVRTKAPEEG